jgi:hypothetical protein
MVFTIGKGDLFCYSTGSQRMSWLSIFPRRQPFHSSSKTQLARQRSWKDPLIGKIIAEAEPSHVYGIKTLPKLPMWGTNRIVLVGDSAHAMSPITGQGASQSLEDAQTLALLLRNMIRKFPADEVNSNSLSITIERTLSTYYDIRHRRVERIAAVGSALDESMLKTQPLAEYIRYTLFRAIDSLPIICELHIVHAQLMLTEDSTARKLVDSLNERLYGWDAKEGVESAMSKSWRYKEPYEQQRFDTGTVEVRISPESMGIIDDEFLRLKEFNEIKLNGDIRDFLEDVHSSFKSKCALNPRGPKFKKSLIHYAAMGDCSELLRFLLANGAPKDDRDQNSRTPLSWAAEYGALKSVKILLEYGAEINSKDDMFSTPLSWLVHSGVPTPQLAATEAYLRQKGAKEKGAKRSWILRKIRML